MTSENIREYAERTDEMAVSTLRSSPIFRRYVRPCCAEILGTLLYTFTSTMCLTASTENSQAIIVSLAQGGVILTLYGSLAEISGGHYNPAITFASWLAGSTGCVLMIFYIICQMFGAFIGAILMRIVLARHIYLTHAIITIPTVNFAYTDIGQTILMELIGSFIWSFVLMMTTIDTNKPAHTGGIFVSAAVFIASLLSYGTSKANLNPAKAFGSTLAYYVFGGGEWNEHYVFWVGPFLGAAIAAMLYRLLFANDEKRILFKK